MNYPLFLACFFTFVPIGLFTSMWLHDFKFYIFKQKYIDWIIDNYGAFIIMYVVGMIFFITEIQKRVQ